MSLIISMKVSSEWRFSNENGKKIFCRCWNEDPALKSNSSGQLKAIVLIIHGFAEHCLWYNELAEVLIQEGYLVVAHDHVGHGQSEGDKAHINCFSEYVRDIFQHADIVKKTYPKLPIFLIGHSMGGCLSIMAGLEKPDYFQGMILIGPAIIPNKNAASPFKIFMGKLLARIFPQLPIIKLDSTTLSRDKAVVKKYDDDPLVYHSGLKARWGLAFLSALEKIKMEQENVDWPLLILHGELDALCDPEGSKMLQEKAKSKDKQLKALHETKTKSQWSELCLLLPMMLLVSHKGQETCKGLETFCLHCLYLKGFTISLTLGHISLEALSRGISSAS